MDFFKSAAAAGLILAVLDLLWLGVIAKGWLAQQLGPRRGAERLASGKL